MTDQVSDRSSSVTAMATIIDATYEFSAPRFFDFINGETDEDRHKAELWFESALSYAPSPCMVRIKTGRTITVETLCDFSDTEKIQKGSESSASVSASSSSETKAQSELIICTTKEEAVNSNKASPDVEVASSIAPVPTQGNISSAAEIKKLVGSDDKENIRPAIKGEVQTPKAGTSQCHRGDAVKNLTAKKIASLIRNPSALKPRNSSQSSSKTPNPTSIRRSVSLKNTAATPNLAQENQAIKRQKLDGGKARQILNVKPLVLNHKSKLGMASNNPSVNHVPKEERKLYVRDPPAHFVATAEMVKKFQSGTRDLSWPHVSSSLQAKPKLTLTRPKGPEFETSHRVRSVPVKSSAELEAEMMAQIPKFKARPINKKILEGPTLPAVPRSVPKQPEFQEFHLQTMARASQNAESASVTSTEASHQANQRKPYYLLTEQPRTPALQTALRARAHPPRVKSSVELEQEELEKLPKFKARPLNKKILESRGSLGVFCHTKKQQTKPQEFHFATDERYPQQTSVFDLFDKLSLNSEPRQEPLPRNTNPSPFHLHTEERGAEKERRFLVELMQKQIEEEKARVPKANPYPYTTDYPVVPPKPGPKLCTRPEPFQLESLVRHEEELRREMEERRRKEEEEARMRIFKAQPVLKEDPIPLPEKVRMPLTEVQEFNHHVDHRAMDRAEFDHMVKEKEMMYKRYREETEAERMMEEEKALKQMRRTMVPHARPVPNFNHPFCPQKSNKEPTKAKSPNLRVIRRKEMRRKTVGAIPAMSSAAANMR